MSHRSSSSDSVHRWNSRGNEHSVLKLTVEGSAAPRATRPPRPQRKPSQPPNSPARPLTLPVDRAILLKADLSRRLEDGCDFSTRPPSVGSSHPDLALDLSSVTDSCPGTDRSTTASSCDESEWSAGWTPHRPLLRSSTSSRTYSVRESSPWVAAMSKKTEPHERMSQLSCSSSSSRRTSNISKRSEWSCEKCSQRSSTRSHADLIGVYVDTVNNSELTKYFRPCVTCKQICCQCPPSPLVLELCTTCGSKSCTCQVKMQCEKCGYDGKVQALVGSEPHQQQAVRASQPDLEMRPCTSDEDRNSVVSRYLLERRFSPAINSPVVPVRHLFDQNGDSGNSTLQLEDSERDAAPSILSRQHVSLSVMELATAAQCARILADSLESVLELAKGELSHGSAPNLAAASSAFNHKSLLAALSDLNLVDECGQESKNT